MNRIDMTRHFGPLASPPALRRLVARGFVACAIAMRVDLETHDDTTEVAELMLVARDWLAAHGYATELDPDEAALLAATPGTLARADRERFGAQPEAAVVLGWALQLCQLPPFDSDADGAATAAALGWLTDGGAALATQARLRPREQLMALLDALGAVHWRLLEHTRRADAAVSMQHFSATEHAWPPDVTPCELLEGDLAIGGRALRELAPATLYATLRRLQERHRAALWALGQQHDYWQVALPG
jgi:hypothetical protein